MKLKSNSFLKKKFFPKGLKLSTILFISKIKEEPEVFYKFRKKAYKNLKNIIFPSWSPLIRPSKKLIYLDTLYFSLNNTFNKIIIKKNINLNKFKSNSIEIFIDNQIFSISQNLKLEKLGIIFCSINDGIKEYSNLIIKFLNKVVNSSDNIFSLLNSSIFSDGSFCFVPQNINCPTTLSSYFKIYNLNNGQFERTLLICDKNSSLTYLEGCSASRSSNNQLHAAVVELISFDKSILKYTTLQNWYSGNLFGVGGIYNFVTKRGLCLGKESKLFWVQLELGSAFTWKYPSTILLGEKTQSEFYSISIAKKFQKIDTGTKMIHLGINSKSYILVKSLSKDFSINIYRSLVKFLPNSNFSKNYSQCDSLIFNKYSRSLAQPYFQNLNFTCICEHEAKISKLSEDELFYLTQKGISFYLAKNFLIKIFFNNILNLMPLDYILEAELLLNQL